MRYSSSCEGLCFFSLPLNCATRGEKQLIICADEDESLNKNGDCFAQSESSINKSIAVLDYVFLSGWEILFCVFLGKHKILIIKNACFPCQGWSINLLNGCCLKYNSDEDYTYSFARRSWWASFSRRTRRSLKQREGRNWIKNSTTEPA